MFICRPFSCTSCRHLELLLGYLAIYYYYHNWRTGPESQLSLELSSWRAIGMKVKSRLESIKQTDLKFLIFLGVVHSRALVSGHTMQSVDNNQPKSVHFFSSPLLGGCNDRSETGNCAILMANLSVQRRQVKSDHFLPASKSKWLADRIPGTVCRTCLVYSDSKTESVSTKGKLRASGHRSIDLSKIGTYYTHQMENGGPMIFAFFSASFLLSVPDAGRVDKSTGLT